MLYEDAKACIRAPLPAGFAATLAAAVPVATRSRDRDDYILHPPTGEMLDEPSLARVAALRDAQQNGDVLGAHHLVNEAYRTDVRPLLARVREELGAPADPVAAYRASGYEERIRGERGITATSGGFQ